MDDDLSDAIEENDVIDDDDEHDDGDAGAEGGVATCRPRSPCCRRKEDAYGLISSTSFTNHTTSIEAQIVEVTYRDHDLPACNLTCPSSLDVEGFADVCYHDVDPSAVGLHVDMHLVDADGRSITATIGTRKPFARRVNLVLKQTTGSSPRAVDELVQTISSRLGMRDSQELTRNMRTFRQSLLVGFDPCGNDPLARNRYQIVSFAFATNELASRVKRMQHAVKPFEIVDPRADVVIAFLIERNLEACGWVRIANARVAPATTRTSSAQLEVSCGIEDVHPLDRRSVAPIMVASYDIETYGSRGAGVFPDADIDGDYVCAITTNFWRAGSALHDRFNVVMIVGQTHAHHGSDTAVECFATEKELLLAWSALIRKVDPKIISGYNIYRFDNEYLCKRAQKLRERLFWHFGAFLCEPAEPKAFKLESAAFGQNEGMAFDIKGKVVLDLMQHMMQSYKLPLYNLNYVSKHFLGNSKTDLDIPTMFKLVEKGEFDRLIAYVQRDGELVQELLKNRDVINSVVEMSRATSTFPTDILTRGQQIRVMNRLRRTCADRGVAILPPPVLPKRRFIGARVVKPQKGFFDPANGKVITLDFASLYPSIVRAYNLCYQTWIDPRHIDSIRNKFPDLEIVEHTLTLGQVWEEVRALPPGAAIEIRSAPKLVDLAQKQLKRGYVDVALTDDEFEEAVRPLLCGIEGGELTRHHVITLVDPTTAKPRRFRPKNVSHSFAKGVPQPDGSEKRCPSLLPEILEELGKLRKKAKKAMGVAEADASHWTEEAERLEASGVHADEVRKRAAAATELAALYDKEQLAYKVVMNSVYGFTAADTLRLLALAETITALGRKSLGASIEIAERLCVEMGFPDSRVVYGDTDSIFVHVDGASAGEALDVGAKISSECNAHFQRETKSSVLKLEFEALFEGLVLIGKKTYAGLQHAVFEKGTTTTKTYNGRPWEIEEHGMSSKPKKYKKGMRAVRRDTPPFVATTQSEALDLLLETKSVAPVLRYIEEAILRLVRVQVPRPQFQITMQLKREEDYVKAPGDAVAKQPHLRLVKKLERRSHEGTLPQGCTLWGVGERVPFYYAETDDGVACDRAECPAYGEVHSIPYDRVHYFDLVEKALDQGLSVVPEVKTLLRRLDAEHIAVLRDTMKRRRKLAEERRKLAANGQRSITGFLRNNPTTAGDTVGGSAIVGMAPPAKRRMTQAKIMDCIQKG